MKNFLTIAYYELKRILRDHRLVLMVLSQPLVISLIVGCIAFRDPQDIKVGLINKNENNFSSRIIDKLREGNELKIEDVKEVDINQIKTGDLRGFIILDIKEENNQTSGKIELLTSPAGQTVPGVIEKKVAEATSDVSQDIAMENVNSDITQALQNVGKLLPAQVSLPKITIDKSAVNAIEIDQKDATPLKLQHFDFFASGMMVLMILLVVLNLSGISITTERVTGTFERLSVTPYSKGDIIAGKAMAHCLIGALVAAIGITNLYLIFHISVGNIGLVILINLIVVAVAVTLGLLISSITYTVVESVEMAMYIFFISVLSTSLIGPFESAYKYFPYFAKAMPFYYAVDASRRVNMLDAGWSQIATNIYILLGFLAVFIVLSLIFLRRGAR
ncbi:hypothetical protein A2V71_01580 [Candidatus Berkelbacteria bacterium RBG_13_40_8]|uniref:ABC transmembrane type-2 domain-containing protein n=1 Tax=Candidatus Berkelbacteria bacterium RBG_13_40_8 TaxID=1797467 RepID=A0A1F5DP50_9BACT|nr:MAG: hypothetical protein A2V71_01580 [Candidatus Berkelbacteria bacterium RBG_13_40_8]